jgi:DNA-binding transcriptional ArsR family regulator
MLKVDIDIELVAKALKELGHPTRLAIYKQAVKAGFSGLPVGAIQEQLGIPNSTLSHHISSLTSANLLHQRREGRTLYCVAKFETLSSVISFLQEECCIDEVT